MLPHLNTADVNATHAPTAVDEEDELSLYLPQVRGHRLEVWAEVEHDHRAVEEVFVKTLANDLHLLVTRVQERSWKERKGDLIITSCDLLCVFSKINPHETFCGVMSVSLLYAKRVVLAAVSKYNTRILCRARFLRTLS